MNRLFSIGLLSVLAGPVAAAGLALMVPAYFDPSPGHDWDRLAVAAARVPLVAIMNPANGPGPATTDAQYLRAIQAVRRAGGRVTGYVFTRYGQRPLAEVQADLRRYHDLYPLDGFFLDEMANGGGPTSVDYYAELYAYIHRLKPSYHVTGNPGTRTAEIYISRPTVDTVVTFEEGAGYSEYAPAAWNRGYPAHRFCHLLHSVTNIGGFAQALILAQSRNAGFVYVTDDVLPNPWDRLPTDWDAQVDRVEAINRAAAEGSPPRLELKRTGDGQGRLELNGPAGRYVMTRAQTVFQWLPLSTNLTFTGQLTLEPILWVAASGNFFRASVE